MKLLSRTGYILVTTLLFIFFFGSIVFYFVLKSETDKEIENELISRMEYMIHEVKSQTEHLSSLSIPADIKIEIVEIPNGLPPFFKDTLLYNPIDSTYDQFKSLTSEFEANSEVYRITLYSSLIESNELIEQIILIALIILMFFIIIVVLINRFMFRSVWADFFNTLKMLKNYNIDKGKGLVLDKSDISEFNLLNETLNQMIEKIHVDYDNIREFTGNISHEIQTPLTIIRQKLELLLQSEPLNSEQAEIILDIQKTNSRLAKLNRTLVLLTRIESKQFNNYAEISLADVIESQIEIFQSIAVNRNITVNYTKTSEIVLMAEPMLIEVLIVNLLKNAIVHNKEQGILNIDIEDKKLTISNTGLKLDLSTQDIFERHTKINRNSESLGLGLFLVKKICDLSDYQVSYSYSKELHTFTVSF